VAIFVFSYFRAFVIDSISSHHNLFHDKRRSVEVEDQADAEARCAEIGPHRCEVHVLHGPWEFLQIDHENTKVRKHEEIKNRDSTLSWLSEASGKRRFLGTDPIPSRGPTSSCSTTAMKARNQQNTESLSESCPLAFARNGIFLTLTGKFQVKVQ
jgi:hypothetical protein